MSVFREYSDPRLAAVYDAIGPDRRDTDFYLGLAAELAVMTGHVAQVIADDESWQATLAAARRALRPGGRVAFESRNPDARGWQAWTRRASLRQADDGAGGRFEWWYELTEVLGGGELVRSEVHYRFPAGAEEIISPNELRFRARATLTSQLTAAGLSVEHVFGDWDRRPAGPGTPEMIFVAVRPR